MNFIEKSVIIAKPEVREDFVKSQIRITLDGMYDIQKVRIATANRVGAYIRSSHPELSEIEQADLVKMAVDEYRRIEDILNGTNKRWSSIQKHFGDSLKFISSHAEFQLVKSYVLMHNAEEIQNKVLKTLVESHPMWDGFLKNVKGCGPAIAGNLIGYLDVHVARHVSSFWSYAGVGTRVADDGSRVAMSKRSTVDVEYMNKEGKIATKKSIGYNPNLHTKLLGVFVDSCLRAGSDGNTYAEVYYDYKNRYTNREDLKDASKMRIHRMAARQCVKALLRDLWVAWRSYEGYEISRPYEIEYLGRAPHKYNEAHDRAATV